MEDTRRRRNHLKSTKTQVANDLLLHSADEAGVLIQMKDEFRLAIWDYTSKFFACIAPLIGTEGSALLTHVLTGNIEHY